jgi:hypothetical protein
MMRARAHGFRQVESNPWPTAAVLSGFPAVENHAETNPAPFEKFFWRNDREVPDCRCGPLVAAPSSDHGKSDSSRRGIGKYERDRIGCSKKALDEADPELVSMFIIWHPEKNIGVPIQGHFAPILGTVRSSGYGNFTVFLRKCGSALPEFALRMPPLGIWELDEAGQPTQKIIERRRSAKFITPIPDAQTIPTKIIMPYIYLYVKLIPSTVSVADDMSGLGSA